MRWPSRKPAFPSLYSFTSTRCSRDPRAAHAPLPSAGWGGRRWSPAAFLMSCRRSFVVNTLRHYARRSASYGEELTAQQQVQMPHTASKPATVTRCATRELSRGMRRMSSTRLQTLAFRHMVFCIRLCRHATTRLQTRYHAGYHSCSWLMSCPR